MIKDLPKKVASRDGKEIGTTTGTQKHCQLSGCTGMRIGVRWPDGTLTWPCSKGMDSRKKRWRIL